MAMAVGDGTGEPDKKRERKKERKRQGFVVILSTVYSTQKLFTVT
jgi:hypothetical protein